VADPSSRCGQPEEWDYFIRTYFPQGLQFIQNPDGYRRVWYITYDGQQNPQLFQAITKGRVAERFVGPAGCLFRLYEAPPDSVGIPFENGLRFHGMDVMDGERPWSAPLVRREGESIRVRLWWSVDQPPPLDYSIGTYVMRDDHVFAEADSPPQLIYPEDAPQETSRWKPGQYYVEQRDLVLPYPTPAITMYIKMAVYFWQDGKRLSAPGMDENHLLTLARLTVMGY